MWLIESVFMYVWALPQKEVDKTQPVITLEGIRGVKLRSVAERGIKVSPLKLHPGKTGVVVNSKRLASIRVNIISTCCSINFGTYHKNMYLIWLDLSVN